MRLSFWPTEDTDFSPCVALGLLLAVCSRKEVVLVSLYKDRDHDVPKVHLYIISCRGVGLSSRSSEVTQQSTAPCLWEQRSPQEACPQHPHRHSEQTTDWLSYLHGPLGIQLWRARKLKLVRWKNLRCHAGILRRCPSSSNYQLSAVSWSCKAEVPVSIEQNLIHPENFEILNFCPRGGEAIASWNAFSETVRMNYKIKWCKICSFNLTIRSILSSNPVLRENLNFPWIFFGD